MTEKTEGYFISPRARTFIKVFGGAFGLTVFSLGIWTVIRLLGDYSPRDILASIREIPLGIRFLAVLLTATSYSLLTLFDMMAFQFLDCRLDRRKIYAVSAIAFAFGNNIGLANLAGGSVRLRLYSLFGIKPFTIIQIILFSSLTFWIGVCALGGILLSFHSLNLPAYIPLSPLALRLAGHALIVIAFVYLLLSALHYHPMKLFGNEIRFPAFRLALSQMLVAAGDWVLAASVLYLLLPASSHSDFLFFLTVFVAAQVIAMIAHVPGGVGVLEALILYFMSNGSDRGEIMAGLLAYRMIYYFLPLACAISGFIGLELSARRTPLVR